MKARSLWYTDVRKLEVREIDLPSLHANEALVRVEACGVCAWDLFIYSGGFQKQKPFPFYFGHEGIGRVVEVGPDVRRIKPGDRVALTETRQIGSIGGGHMAEYGIQNESSVIPLPDDGIPAEHWMIEPVSCCVNAMNLVHVKPGAKVALVGSGFMGGILLQLLAMSPVTQIDVFDTRKESLNYAARLGAAAPIRVFDVKDLDIPHAGNRSGNSAADPIYESYDIVFEAAAAEPAFRLANRLVRAGGTLAIFSWHHHDIKFDFGEWHVKGVTVLNTSPAAASPHFHDCFYQSIPLITTGRIELADMVTHVASLDQAAPLFEKGITREDGYVKGVIRFD